MKGSGTTRLCSSIANGGMGQRTRTEAPDETIWFDETNKFTDTTENTQPKWNLRPIFCRIIATVYRDQ